MFKFSKNYYDLRDNLVETISMETCQDSEISDLIELFRRFLIASGYHPKTVEEYMPDCNNCKICEDCELREEETEEEYTGTSFPEE